MSKICDEDINSSTALWESIVQEPIVSKYLFANSKNDYLTILNTLNMGTARFDIEHIGPNLLC